MSTLFTQNLYSIEEASNLYHQVSGDVSALEGSSVDEAAASWDDLNNLSSEYSDLLYDSNSSASSFVSKIKNDGETYLKSVDLEIEQPNTPGQYVSLYEGSLNGYDSNGDIEETTNGVATLWDAITASADTTYVNDPEDAYFDNSNGPQEGLGTDWSQHGSFSWETESSGNPNSNGEYAAAQGTMSQWSQYIHLQPGNTAALNNDLMQA